MTQTAQMSWEFWVLIGTVTISLSGAIVATLSYVFRRGVKRQKIEIEDSVLSITLGEFSEGDNAEDGALMVELRGDGSQIVTLRFKPNTPEWVISDMVGKATSLIRSQAERYGHLDGGDGGEGNSTSSKAQ
jgi:hypothetical protein